MSEYPTKEEVSNMDALLRETPPAKRNILKGWKRRPVLVDRVEALLPTTTAQNKMPVIIGGHARLLKKKSTREAEATWWNVLAPIRAKLDKPICGPVYARFILIWPWLSSTSARLKRECDALPKPAKPDLDNLCKILLDTMTRQQFWADDAQVCSLTVSKWHGERGALHVEIGNIVRAEQGA